MLGIKCCSKVGSQGALHYCRMNAPGSGSDKGNGRAAYRRGVMAQKCDHLRGGVDWLVVGWWLVSDAWWLAGWNPVRPLNRLHQSEFTLLRSTSLC